MNPGVPFVAGAAAEAPKGEAGDAAGVAFAEANENAPPVFDDEDGRPALLVAGEAG